MGKSQTAGVVGYCLQCGRVVMGRMVGARGRDLVHTAKRSTYTYQGWKSRGDRCFGLVKFTKAEAEDAFQVLLMAGQLEEFPTGDGELNGPDDS